MLRWYYRNPAGSIVEIVNRVQLGPKGTDGLTTNAEEGSVATSTIYIEDPDGDFEIGGHRLVYAQEDEILDDDYGGVVWVGYTGERKYQRGDDRGLLTGPARVIEVQLVDLNTILERRIMRDEDARPAESDVARVQWAEASPQGSMIDDTRFLFDDTPFQMDKNPEGYLGQKLKDAIDDCAQQSGKNYYLTHFDMGAGAALVTYSLWYGHSSREDYASTISISNVLSDFDGDTVFEGAPDSTHATDPSRVYSGAFVQFDGDNAYVERPETEDAFALEGRDEVVYAPNVKTATKAKARGRRYLVDIASEEETIETSIYVPPTHVNKAMPGMWIPVKFSHFTGYETFVPMRIVTRTIRPVLTPTGARSYRIQMTLKNPTPGANGNTEVFGVLLGPENEDREPDIHWAAPGDTPPSGYKVQPTLGPLSYTTGGHTGHTYEGIQADADMTVDIKLRCSIIEVISGPSLISVDIYKNGTLLGSNSGTYFGSFASATRECLLTGVFLEAGDVITGKMEMSNTAAAHPSGKIPAGTGSHGNRLQISGVSA